MPSDAEVEAAHKSLWSSKHWGLPDVRRALEAAEAVRERDITAMVDDAMVEAQGLHPPLRRSDCERIIRAALASSGGNRAGD